MATITHRKNPSQPITFQTPPADAPIEKLNDFYWTNETEPHTIRRKLILKKYPKITELCGPEPLTKYIIFGVVSLQLSIAYYLRNTPFLSWKFFLLSYIIGATANQNVFLAIHELTHNLAFKKPLHNKLYAIFTNIPIGIPYSASFQPYHQLHHKYLGDEVLDTDVPTKYEAIVLSNVLGKSFFATFQILFYALRPMFITQIKFTYIHLLNVLVQLFVDFLIVKYWGWKSLSYFIFSSFLAGSLHPCSGHFIAEHYIMDPPKTYNRYKDHPPLETYSYYGALNLVTWNVGLHNEHHDFPYVAWSKLHKLNEVANEFYCDLPKHDSWTMVIVNFILDKNVLLYNRVKRETAKK
ncbi:sphingolipid delta4-desaturase [Wickerhamomyces ciferrii]|uniref:Sphingolipid delta(4)-desaturase n=2 Tax=Wickerhamomyces ciferrii TaxID=1041607 RepID=K0KSL1_WICCF|nr:sphingolipid delta4-desaturase [Wickerhamomyces ciferrii]ADW79425.1 sphingolipid delta4-desaturase [Wickerhamomyces ciferrii]CCH44308.1 sphingolipid delta4-desaturase [Wickerhamomyces ciferrii]